MIQKWVMERSSTSLSEWNERKEGIMNTRVNSIKQFLDEYKNKSESLKILTQDTYKYYYQELIKEYAKLMKHPYALEQLDMEKSLYRYEKHIKYQ